jgi:CspA family cold shock protein
MTDKEVFYGEVIWFDAKKGFGFLRWANSEGVKQKDIFIHFSDINCEGFKTLLPDQKVSFEIGQNRDGVAKAVNVTALKH